MGIEQASHVAECVVISDIMAEGAYNKAVKGAKFIIYYVLLKVFNVEIQPKDFKSVIIKPAIIAIVSILKAALKTISIRRIITIFLIIAFVL